jgi:hypothetical protein
MNPTRFLFIYRNRRQPVRFEAAWIEQCGEYHKLDWEHAATIYPDSWIEYLLNTPPEARNAHIATIKKPQT